MIGRGAFGDLLLGLDNLVSGISGGPAEDAAPERQLVCPILRVIELPPRQEDRGYIRPPMDTQRFVPPVY